MASLLTDDSLHVVRKDGTVSSDVWAVGDAAIIKDGLLPATAQGGCSLLFFVPTDLSTWINFAVAQQKAKYVTRVLNRLAKEKQTTEPFKFHNQGSLAYLGDWKALYDRTSVENGPKGKEAG